MTGAAVAAAVALTATPSRVRLNGAGRARVEVTNRGRLPVVLDVSKAGFALDLRGRPRVVASAPARWLAVSPSRVTVDPGDAAVLTLSSRVPNGASPGDHPALVLVATRPPRSAAIAVQLRLGVVVVLRVPGKVVHRLAVTAVRAVHHLLRLHVANRGNVAEMLAPALTLWRGGQVVARLRAQRRELLPHARGIVEYRVRPGLAGRFTARFRLRSQNRGFRVTL